MHKLKPCPFCGGTKISLVGCEWMGKAQCRECGADVIATTYCEKMRPVSDYWMKAAARKWNRRAE